ncbi:MAG: OmpA family protein [bacterium]
MNRSFLKTIMVTCIIVLHVTLLTRVCYGSFEDIGWGARPTGMGGAFTALANDSNSIMWNPAGIAHVDRSELNLMYAKLFSGLDSVKLGLNYFSFIQPIKNAGVFGINWANFISTDQYREDTFVLSYAQKVFYSKDSWLEEVALGANLKYMGYRYTLDSYAKTDPVFVSSGNDKSSFGFDAGIQIKPVDYLSVGLSVINLNQPDVGLKETEKLPVETRVGAGVFFSERTQAGFDISYLTDDLNFHVGLEHWLPTKVLALRCGANLQEIALGMGLRSEVSETFELQFDYSFIWPLEVQETYGSHRLSLLARFGKSADTKEKEARETEELKRLEAEKARALAEAEKARKEAEEARKKAKEAEEAAKRARAEEEARRLAAEAERLALIEKAKAAQLQVKEEGKDVIITLHVNFDFNKATIKETEKTKLTQVSEILKTFTEYDVRVEGHTDSVGTEEYNLKLSEERAHSVAMYLSSEGVGSDRISYVGYGEAKPVADNTTKEGQALNRRVEFVVITEKK